MNPERIKAARAAYAKWVESLDYFSENDDDGWRAALVAADAVGVAPPRCVTTREPCSGAGKVATGAESSQSRSGRCPDCGRNVKASKAGLRVPRHNVVAALDGLSETPEGAK